MADQISDAILDAILKEDPYARVACETLVKTGAVVLSNGHGSMLQYALLHLTGYDLSIEDLKAFRQLHSKTPGHPFNKASFKPQLYRF